MQHITKSEIYFDGEHYCARCLDIDVFTQGNTLDEVMTNLQEAVSLHLEDEEPDHVVGSTSFLAMMEVPV